ncbi:MAG: hypothetical protein ACOYOS_00025 [Syntrophales bacterium]
MELYEYNKLLTELSDYYERKEPKPGTTELWFDKVKKIPDEPLKWIAKKIESENESFPRNLPLVLWGAYREWQQANPQKMAHKRNIECADCADGLLPVRATKEGIPYTYVFRCGRCKQSTTQAYPMATRDELMAEGYYVIPKNGEPYTGPRRRNVPEMLAGIGVGGQVG